MANENIEANGLSGSALLTPHHIDGALLFMKLTKKQTIAIDILEDDSTTELYYGGAAGGGKSVLGCYWQLKRRLKFPGTRGFIGRSELKNLKKTTLNSFFEVCKMQGLKAGIHYTIRRIV